MRRFVEIRASLWMSYYGRIPGATSAFHVRARNVGRFWPEADWQLGHQRHEVPFCQDPSIKYDTGPRDLAVAVNKAKKAGSEYGRFGGSFLINEVGEVLVPSQDGSRILHVGRWTGPILIQDPRAPDDPPLDIYDTNGLVAGDSWDKPYVGSLYLLAHRNDTDIVMTWDATGFLDVGDLLQTHVVPQLRALRPEGDVRFIVTYGGVVLTKIPLPGRWTPDNPVYAGHVDPRKWQVREV